MSQVLEERLGQAVADVHAVEAIHRALALAAEEGGANPKRMAEAVKALQDAKQRVADVTAAIAAATARDNARVAAEAEALIDAEKAAVRAALMDLDAAGNTWDAALDALVSATEGLLAEKEKLEQAKLTQRVYISLDRARENAMSMIEFRLAFWVGHSRPRDPCQQTKITAHFPKPE